MKTVHYQIKQFTGVLDFKCNIDKLTTIKLYVIRYVLEALRSSHYLAFNSTGNTEYTAVRNTKNITFYEKSPF